MTAFLQAINVTKHYPPSTHALLNANLEVRQGETVALIGESGCGKSTLLRLFNRMTDPTSGEVYIRGKRAAEIDPVELRRATGYVQQEGGLLPHWTVRRNVGLVPSLLGWERTRIEARVEALLDLVNLPPGEFQHRYPLELSGGQRQRVAFARSLAADPDLVLLDEPFGALDAITRQEVQHEFQRIQDRVGKTMLLVTHDLEEAFRLGTRIAVMQSGRVLQVGTPSELKRTPRDPFVRKLIARRSEDLA